MRSGPSMSPRLGKGIIVALVLVFSVSLIALAGAGSPARGAAAVKSMIDASILKYDGTDFTRTQTTLVTEDGKSAVNTKLDHSSPAYAALTKGHSYTGDASVFGKKYEADYAPLTDSDGKVTGALFVGVRK